MKKLIFVLLLLPAAAFADGVVAPVLSLTPPDWLGTVVQFLAAVPYVGPVIVEVLKWVGLISAVATALSVLAQTLLALPEVAARWAGAHAIADKIKSVSDVVLPWLKWLSVFNVQKPTATKVVDLSGK